MYNIPANGVLAIAFVDIVSRVDAIGALEYVPCDSQLWADTNYIDNYLLRGSWQQESQAMRKHMPTHTLLSYLQKHFTGGMLIRSSPLNR